MRPAGFFRGLTQLISIVDLVRDRLNHQADFKVLVTNFDSRLAHSFKMLEKIKEDFKERLFSNIIHVNVKLKEAQNQGKHVLDFDKYCRGAKDYFSLAREIITQEKTPTPALVLEKRMQEILKEQLPRLTEVAFSIFAPKASDVYLVGEFNNWQVNESARMIQNNGTWNKKINLNTGRYRYRFVVDGNWVEDTANPQKEANPYGSLDSLVEVKAK